MNDIPRLAKAHLERALKRAPCVMIVGPRQAGKSTLAQQVSDASRTRLTLDDHSLLTFATEAPAQFLKAHLGPVLIDEIQRAPGLLPAIKQAVDEAKTPGRFLLTGSANVLALPKVSESLAGRMEVIDLTPFTQAELTSLPSDRSPYLAEIFDWAWRPPSAEEDGILDKIVRGGFPEPSLRSDHEDRRAWFSSYLRTMLDRDVRDIANIQGLQRLPKLLSLVAADAGSTANVASLSRETKIPEPTLYRYLDMLRALFLLLDIPAWSSDVATRLIKGPKTFIADSGLACSLLGWDADTLQHDPVKRRKMVKTFVANELHRMVVARILAGRIYHFRTIKRHEVDFILERPDGAIVGIQIAENELAQGSDFEGPAFLKEVAGDRFSKGIVLHNGPGSAAGADLWACPLSALWRAPVGN